MAGRRNWGGWRAANREAGTCDAKLTALARKRLLFFLALLHNISMVV